MDDALNACAEATRRANKWFEWRMESDPLLDIAQDHLTLARTGLYRAILESALPAASALRTSRPSNGATTKRRTTG